MLIFVFLQQMKELMGLVASTVLRCNDCISHHLIECIAHGATEDEIVDALGIAMVAGGSITIPHLRHALSFMDTIEQADTTSDES